MKKKEYTTVDFLKDGFDIVWLMNDQLGNVIASGDYSKSDKEYKEKCERFIKYFKKINKR